MRVGVVLAAVPAALIAAGSASTLPLPEWARIALAFAAFVPVPGHLLLGALRTTPPGGRLTAGGWALGLGVAWQGSLALGLHLAGRPNTELGRAAGVAVLALAVARLLDRRPPPPHAARRLARPAAVAIVIAAAWALLHVGRHGPALNALTDSPDHVGTIRRILATGDAFPRDAFFRDAGPEGADPRKGLWHPVVAAIAGAAGADPIPAWHVLSALLAPLLVLNVAAFAFLAGGSLAAALAAFMTLLAYGGGLGTPYLGEAVFATKLADQLALAALTALLADLAQPRAATRIAFIGLALGAVLTHVFAAIHLGIVGGALLAAVVVRDRALAAEGRRLLGSGLALAVPAGAFLAWRALTAWGPGNVIHTEMQGMLLLGPTLRVYSPGVLWDWMGRTWWLWPLLTPWLLARPAHTPRLMLGATAVAVAVLLFVPPIPQWLQPRLGYLPMRFVWLLPTAALAGIAAAASLAALHGPRRRRAVLALLVLGWTLAPSLADALRDLTGTAAARESVLTRDMASWRPALARLETMVPAGTVVLADPATSYAVPLATRLHVATLVDQHGTPNDPRALERMLDARDALDPEGRWSRTTAVLRRYGVGAIVLNGRFTLPARLDYWSVDPEWYRRARPRFDAHPGAFPVLFDDGDLVAYQVRPDSLAGLPDPPVKRPMTRPYAATRDRALGAPRPGLPVLVGAGVAPVTAQAGDTVRVALAWHATLPLPPGSYEISIRCDRLRDARSAPAGFGKPGRKLFERWRGARERFREDHLPVAGAYGVDLWPDTLVVLDTTRLVVPGDALPGRWRVEARMHRQPHYPNLVWADFVSDRDYFSGDSIGVLEIRDTPAAAVRR